MKSHDQLETRELMTGFGVDILNIDVGRANADPQFSSRTEISCLSLQLANFRYKINISCALCPFHLFHPRDDAADFSETL